MTHGQARTLCLVSQEAEVLLRLCIMPLSELGGTLRQIANIAGMLGESPKLALGGNIAYQQ